MNRLKKWFYPHAKVVSSSVLGREEEWKGRVPILVEDAWDQQQVTIEDCLRRLDHASSLLNDTHPAAANSIDNFIKKYKYNNRIEIERI
jgi:hypothetical protein